MTSGGTSSTGGSSAAPLATGGTTSTCANIVWPSVPAATEQDQLRQAKSHKLSKRKPRKASRAPNVTEQILAQPCSTFNQPIVATPLDQIDGSCTGHALVGMISTPPYKSTIHFNENDALLAYQNGTCVDNGCSIPCTCFSCPQAYCPNTHANDTGSLGSSVSEFAVKVGWMRGYLAADTTTDLHAGLGKSACMGGFDWYWSMMATTNTGEIKLVITSGKAGGHQLEIVGHDAILKRTWVRNSWGPKWGWCNAIGCGYGWIADTNLPKLNFDADCPVL